MTVFVRKSKPCFYIRFKQLKYPVHLPIPGFGEQLSEPDC